MDLNDLTSLGWAAALLLLLLGSYAAGIRVRRRLPPAHDTREMADVLRAVNGALVTFTAVVLSLLVNSAKTSFDAAGADVARFGIQIVKVDHLLREYGAEAAPIRAALAQYVGTTQGQFQGGTPFSGAGSRALDAMEDGIRRLHPGDELHRRLQSEALNRTADLLQFRSVLTLDRSGGMTVALFAVLVFWATAAFFTFGLNAMPNPFLRLCITICALAVASAVFVILDMETPFNGLIAVSDRPLAGALARLNQPDGG